MRATNAQKLHVMMAEDATLELGKAKTIDNTISMERVSTFTHLTARMNKTGANANITRSSPGQESRNNGSNARNDYGAQHHRGKANVGNGRFAQSDLALFNISKSEFNQNDRTFNQSYSNFNQSDRNLMDFCNPYPSKNKAMAASSKQQEPQESSRPRMTKANKFQEFNQAEQSPSKQQSPLSPRRHSMSVITNAKLDPPSCTTPIRQSKLD